MKTQKSKSKIAVLMGGIGSEREISLQSGNCVADALEQAGFEIARYDIRPNKLEILDDSTIDIFFPVLHGEFGEDGCLQQILEDKSFIYVGSGPEASRKAFDKIESKRIFNEAGITTPAAIEFNNNIRIADMENQLRCPSGKYVVKPVRQGSSVGVLIVSSPQEAIEAADKTLAKFGDCMIEEFVQGREITVGIVCEQVLPIIEIRTKTSFYNYHAKYQDEQTEFLFNTINELSVRAQINKAALDCFEALGCRHFARVDLILNRENVPFVLEVNTIPGFTSHSLLPKAAQEVGLSMSDLCKKIVETAYLSPTSKINIT